MFSIVVILDYPLTLLSRLEIRRFRAWSLSKPLGSR
jgi:hypothetical protein